MAVFRGTDGSDILNGGSGDDTLYGFVQWVADGYKWDSPEPWRWPR